jgi:serine/threonine protein kinase
MQELFSKVTKGVYPDIPKQYSKNLSKVIRCCLNTTPVLRPTAKELLDMPEFGDNTVDKESQFH